MNLDISDFTDLPLKFKEQDNAYHHVLVRENVSKTLNKLKPNHRTLLVLNVPPYATAESLKLAFSTGGPVSNVIIQEKPSDSAEQQRENISKFKVAYIVYDQSASLGKLLKTQKLNALNSDGKLLTGIDKWTKMYMDRIPDPIRLQQEIDKYMASYDRNVEQQKNKNGAEQDDEGWVTVSKSNANTFSQTEGTVNKLEEKIGKDRQTKELKNFYTFQLRESRKNDIVSLRKKYDRDAQKMTQIKKTKRFKPF
ncbi:ribosomal RNA-processing protein 7 homolog A [Toxorhynchites rutilus septentrionalis]|uniref:ribosomal RNA-processing protein 7 homolog A n=1 Tax=Toxorhynchites rutilus septentrionalis TaxID=329112 RepID=UPI00247B1E04|nr:ribosomal RNA-processing protein 7 homolog A [Toxorhynchites rutilus septentrionalis]